MAKLKYDDVKHEIEKEGWVLLTPSYTNLKTEMDFKCPNGHMNVLTFEQWRHNHDCPVCEENKYANISTVPVKKKGYRVLAFDQASITSGWSVFDGDELISYGKWSSDGQHSTERIAQTKGWFASMIKKWKPNAIVLEDIQLQTYSKDGVNYQEMVVVFKKLAHLQGVLKNYCYDNGIPYKIVSPSTWRAHSEVKGKARTDKKKNAQLKVKRLFDIQVTQDEADAILIGRWAAFDCKQNTIIKF